MNAIRIALLIWIVALSGCSAPDVSRSPFNTELDDDFQKAYAIMMGDSFSAEAHQSMREHLHRRLRIEGDRIFASVLERQSTDVQIEVVNVMGFMNPDEYLDFPKTYHILASAPKI